MSRQDAPIAVVGMAVRYPGAASPVELWENVLARRQQFRAFPAERLRWEDYGEATLDAADRDHTYLRRAAFIDGFDFDWAGRRIPRGTFEATDVVHWLALDVALAAVRDAGGLPEDLRPRTGVLVGNIMGGEQARAELLRLRWPYVRRAVSAAAEACGIDAARAGPLLDATEVAYKSAFKPVSEDTITSQLSNTIAGRICNFLDLRGGGYVVDGACASSLLALTTAATALQRGELDLAIAGGVDVSLDIWELASFSRIRAYAVGELAVYDRRASGLLPGEGCGFVVLRRLEDALAAGDRIYAVIRGWGVSTDGKGGLTTPGVEGQRLALERAYDMAGYSASTLSFVEGHGTGTPVGDAVELEALGALLRDAGPRAVGVTSLKSILGHTKAAAGIGGFVKAVLGVARRIIPPTANLKDPHPIFGAEARSLYPVRAGGRGPETGPMRAAVSSMGFGGINCHITLESPPAIVDALAPALDERAILATTQDSELFPLAAPTLDELAGRCEALRALAQGASQAELADLSALVIARLEPGPARAAVVASTIDELIQRLAVLSDRIAQGVEPGRPLELTEGWLGLDCAPPRLGLLFPGQGSPRLDMARALVERHPWARARLARADALLGELGMEPVGPLIYPPVDRARDAAELAAWQRALSASASSQVAIALVSWLYVEHLAGLGVVADVVCGHSQGEQTAFLAAGVTDFDTAMRLAAFTGRSGAARDDGVPAGGMGIVGCDAAAARALVAEVGGPLWVVEVNSPTQVVLAGAVDPLDRALILAGARGVQAQRLEVANAFHTALIGAGVDEMRREAPPGSPVSATALPIVSSMDGRLVPPGTLPRDHFCRMSLSPVDFVAAVATLGERADLLLEVGAGRILSGLVAGCPGAPPCLPVEGAAGRARDLHAALATLHVRGRDLSLSALFEARLIRPYVRPSERRWIASPAERPVTVGHVTRVGAATAPPLGPLELPPAGDGAARADGRIAPAAPVGAPEIWGRLVEEIARRTGFSADGLGADLRLLDDLNLDSLRAGEVVARVARACGVGGALDPAGLSNARLGEIAAALERATRAAAPAPSAAPTLEETRAEILAFINGDLWSLRAAVALARAEATRPGGPPTAALARWLRGLWAPGGRYRAAVVVPAGEPVDARLAALEKMIAAGMPARPVVDVRAGLALGWTSGPARLGYLFPGQGSQRPGMAAGLLSRHAWARERLRRFEEAHPELGLAALAFAPAGPAGDPETARRRAALAETRLAQPAIALCSLLWLELLERLGAHPELTLGHSLGELGALHAAGALGAAETLDLAVLRGAACAEAGPGAMLSLACGPELAEALAREAGVVLANLNAPEQQVLSGAREAIARAADLAAARGVPARALEVSAAFHAPLLAPAAERLRVEAALPVRPPPSRALALSSTDGRPLSPDIELRAHLARQLTAPVDFVAATRALAERVDLVLELGPGGVLGRLWASNVPDGPTCLPLEPSTDPDRALALVVAALLTHGWDLDPSALEAEGSSALSPLVSRYAPHEEAAVARLAALELAGTRWALDHDPAHAALAEALSALLVGQGAQVGEPARRATHLLGLLGAPGDQADLGDPVADLRALHGVLRTLSAAPTGSAVLLVELGGAGEGAARAALASLHHERPDLRSRVVEAPADASPARLLDALRRALSREEAWSAERIDASGRYFWPRVRALDPAPLPARPEAPRAGEVVLVTGGAQGITAECALALALTTGARMVLTGRSPAEDPRVQATLARYAAAGLPCRYLSCDVRDAAAVDALIGRILADEGPIVAVVHGAGLNRPGRVDRVSPEQALSEVGPKLIGALNLLERLREAPPRLWVGMGSVLAWTGMAGNAWYAWSNARLARLLAASGVAALSLDWGLWAEVGMGAREGVAEGLERLGLSARGIPVEVGVRHFLALVLGDPGVNRVAVTFDLSALDTWRPAGHGAGGLLDEVRGWDGARLSAALAVSAARQPWIVDHIVDDVPVWPLVASLGAMSEAAGRLLDLGAPGAIQVEDVWVSRPILAVEGASLEVSVRRVPGPRARAVAALGLAGEVPSVVATLTLLPEPLLEAPTTIEAPSRPLNLLPGPDLYETGLLFHGPRFQRLEAVLALQEGRAAFRLRPDGEPGLSQPRAGDWMLLEGALQAGALTLMPRLALPVALGRVWLAASAAPHGAPRGEVRLERRSDLAAEVGARLVDDAGQTLVIVERAVVRFRGARSDLPSTRALVQAEARDAWRLRRDVQRAPGGPWPAPALGHTPGIHELQRQERHAVEEPILRRALALLGAPDDAILLTSPEGGAPRVEGQPELALSVSHSDALCLCVAARGAPVGCDLSPVRHEDWTALLGDARAALLAALQRREGRPDLAGARIWAAREAAAKALGTLDVQLALGAVCGEAVLLEARAEGGAVTVLTLPLSPEQGEALVVALTAARPLADASARERVFPSPLALRDLAGQVPHVRFTTLHAWMGRLRELAVAPVLDRLAPLLASGVYGMVTIGTRLRTVRPVVETTPLESRLRLLRVGEEGQIDLGFEWLQPGASGELVQMAVGEMRTGWVRVLGHGLAQPEPLPAFFRAYLSEIGLSPPAVARARLSAGLPRAAPGRRVGAPVLAEECFSTTHDDSNLVGNVYFDRYALWQGRLLDAWTHAVLRGEPAGDWLSVDCAIEHLREAMPFDRVCVRARVEAVAERGATFYVEFFRVEADGTLTKLAVSTQELVWIRRARPELPDVLPEALVQALLARRDADAPEPGVPSPTPTPSRAA